MSDEKPWVMPHKMAMVWVDNAEAAEHELTERVAYQKAFGFETLAARLVTGHARTRTVLYRSAASIAVRLGWAEPAAALVAEALEGDIDDVLRHELVEVLRGAVALSFEAKVADATTLYPKQMIDYGMAEPPSVRNGTADEGPTWGDADPNAEHAYCLMCGHDRSPGCVSWCDSVISDGEGEPVLCCDGQCVYTLRDLEVMVKQVHADDLFRSIWETAKYRHLDDLQALSHQRQLEELLREARRCTAGPLHKRIGDFLDDSRGHTYRGDDKK